MNNDDSADRLRYMGCQTGRSIINEEDMEKARARSQETFGRSYEEVEAAVLAQYAEADADTMRKCISRLAQGNVVVVSAEPRSRNFDAIKKLIEEGTIVIPTPGAELLNELRNFPDMKDMVRVVEPIVETKHKKRKRRYDPKNPFR